MAYHLRTRIENGGKKRHKQETHLIAIGCQLNLTVTFVWIIYTCLPAGVNLFILRLLLEALKFCGLFRLVRRKYACKAAGSQREEQCKGREKSPEANQDLFHICSSLHSSNTVD